MGDIYQRFGIETIINAKGPATRLSGGPMAPEVAEAMREAARHCVDIATLQGRASEIITETTGAEAGIVTSGAAAGLMLGTAACVTGLDPAAMNRLPDTTGLRNEVVMVRSQRNFYDHAVRATGITLVEVGLADRYSGAGVRDAEAWEIADAINERTACVFYVAAAQSRPALRQVTEVAHRHGVPVLVDAAAQLPPVGNLRRFIAEDADLVAFSGGKAIGGPQASGLLCGRRDLIAAAALQTLDQDILIEQWTPPPALFAGVELRGLPQHGIGRVCKVGKEQIISLLVALERFVARDTAAQQDIWRGWLRQLAEALSPHQGLAVTIVDHPDRGIPCLHLGREPGASAASALQLVIDLQNSRPGIHVDPARIDQGIIIINPSCLHSAGDIDVIARRLHALLTAADLSSKQ